MKKNKRPQTPKVRNEEWMRAKLDQARSGVQPRPVGTLYQRKPKHVKRGWE
jgi:hypothetical protein